MKHACMSCKTRYDIPDARVAESGASGLRIRCKKCRAIMVVSLAQRLDVDDPADSVTAPVLRGRRRPTITPSAALALAAQENAPQENANPFDSPALTGVHPQESFPIPASSTAKGDVVAKAGVFRSLTGIRKRPEASDTEKPTWFAALNGAPRGPYTSKEMTRLAEDGRVRGSTLVWSPVLKDWSQIRSHSNEKVELSWLRDVVIARKRRENAAQDRAQQMHGITRLTLEPQDMRSTPPPPMPLDDESTDSEFVADGIFGKPHLGDAEVDAGVDTSLETSADTSVAHEASSKGFPMGLLITLGLVTGACAAAAVFYMLSTVGLYSLPLL